MERNVPATTDEQADEGQAEISESIEARPVYRQDLSVAYLPLALVTFLVLAFAAAAWTILAAG